MARRDVNELRETLKGARQRVRTLERRLRRAYRARRLLDQIDGNEEIVDKIRQLLKPSPEDL